MASACAVWAAALIGPESSGVTVLVIGGDAKGYLSPCGCVKPMYGGIRRQGTAVKSLASGTRSAFWVNASMVSGIGRQSELKAESLAEAYAGMKANAINLGWEDARLGAGVLASVDRLSRGAVVSAATDPPPSPGIRQRMRSGPFLLTGLSVRSQEIAAILGGASKPLGNEARLLVQEARDEGLSPAVLLDGSLEDARSLARQAPGLALIVYRSASRPTDAPLREGATVLVTPGDRGKHLLRLEWSPTGPGSYRFVDLGPDFEDEPGMRGVYQRYLRRVESEKLLEALPRSPSAPFAGSEACATCHSKETRAWRSSDHARALASLEKDGHARDPDCTGCHVVGLDQQTGFRSRSETPRLADVGCESCHGPSQNHAENPQVRTGSPDKKRMCTTCHNPDHSPTFEFEPYWSKIKH